MVRQFQLARVARQLCLLRRCNVLEHLICRGRNDIDRTIAHRNSRPVLLSFTTEATCTVRRQLHGTFGHGGLENLDRVLARSTADVAGTVVVVIRKQTGDLAVVHHTGSPVTLETPPLLNLPLPQQRLLFFTECVHPLHGGLVYLSTACSLHLRIQGGKLLVQVG